jgi:hypothetical protein
VSGVSPRPGGWAVAMEDLCLVGVPCGGGAVGVQDEGPAPPVDRDLVVEETLCRPAVYADLKAGAAGQGRGMRLRCRHNPDTWSPDLAAQARVPFGGAYGGGALPAHQFAELRLTPPLALAQGTDVHADNGRLPLRDAVNAATPAPRHAPAPFATIAKIAFPPSSGYQP